MNQQPTSLQFAFAPRSIVLFLFFFCITVFNNSLIAQCSQADFLSYYYECNADGPDHPDAPVLGFYVDITFIPTVASGTFTFRDVNANIADQTISIGQSIGGNTLTTGIIFTYEFGPFDNNDDFDIQLITPDGCIIDIIDDVYNCTNNESAACTDDVPFFDLNFLDQPDATFKINSTSRFADCCSSGDRCVEFRINLDPNTLGLVVELDGAGAGGVSNVYGVLESGGGFDCPDFISGLSSSPSFADDICLTTTGVYNVMACKPGNDKNKFLVRGISAPAINNPVVTENNCDGQFNLSGFDPMETITWSNSDGHDPNEDYLSAINISNPVFNYTGTPLTKDTTFEYQITGTSLGSLCSAATPFSLTTTITVYPDLKASISKSCTPSDQITLTATPSGGSGVPSNYTYQWLNQAGTQVSTTASYVPPLADNTTYKVRIKDSSLDNSCAAVDTFIVALCCRADAGDLVLPTGEVTTPIEICVGESLAAFSRSYAEADETDPGNVTTYPATFLLTNTMGTILDEEEDGDFDFTGLAAGTYHIYSLSYYNLNTPDNITDYLNSIKVDLTPNDISQILLDVADINFCVDLDSLDEGGNQMKVVVNALPTPTLTVAKNEACVDETSVLLTGNPTGGTFSGTGVSGNTFNPSSAGAGPHTITYSVTDNKGCSNSTSKIITVFALPTPTLTVSTLR